MPPRLDPIQESPESSWTLHLPWAVALAALAAGVLVVPERDLGLLGCGAGAFAFLAAAVQLRLRRTCYAVHMAGGLVALTIVHGPDTAGAYVLPAGLLVVAAMAARAAAKLVRPAVAPLAGRVPWRFNPVYRRAALRFGIGGLLGGGLLVALGPTPALRILGVAFVPLALRSFTNELLGWPGTHAVWAVAAVAETAALAAFVPAYGVAGAAWTAVGIETLLFMVLASMVARRTGTRSYGVPQVATLVGAAMLLAAVAIPDAHAMIWPAATLLTLAGTAAVVAARMPSP